MDDVNIAIISEPHTAPKPAPELPVDGVDRAPPAPVPAWGWLAGLLSRTWPLLMVVLVAAALLNGLTLLQYPATFVDEGWNASRSLALLQTGRQFAGVDSGIYKQFEGYWTYWPWLGTAIHAAAIQLLGLSLSTMREVSLVFGLALLAVVFQIGAVLHNRRTGLTAAALLAVSMQFMYSSHMARHDIIVATMCYGAIALQISESRFTATGRRALPFRSLLAGLLVGLSLDVHLNGFIFIPTVGVLYLMDSGRTFLKSKPLWAFIVGLAGAVLYYAAMHILPYPQSVAEIAGLSNFAGRAPVFFSADPAVWFNALTGTLGHLDPRILPVIALATVALIRRGSASDRRLLVLFATVVAVYAVVTSFKTFHYAILIAPAAALLVGALFDIISRRPLRGSLWSFGETALAVGIVAVVVSLNIVTVWSASNSGYDRTADKIVQTIPDGASIIGAPTYWFARPYQPYLNWEQLDVYRGYYPGSSMEDAFDYYRPDYVIVDGFVEYFLAGNPGNSVDRQRSGTLLLDLQQLLGERAVLVGQVETEPYGTVRIYKMAWQP
jgi:4-amino-4-deoxy-L-arabinose transferase-like glycosyltransferase